MDGTAGKADVDDPDAVEESPRAEVGILQSIVITRSTELMDSYLDPVVIFWLQNE